MSILKNVLVPPNITYAFFLWTFFIFDMPFWKTNQFFTFVVSICLDLTITWQYFAIIVNTCQYTVLRTVPIVRYCICVYDYGTYYTVLAIGKGILDFTNSVISFAKPFWHMSYPWYLVLGPPSLRRCWCHAAGRARPAILSRRTNSLHKGQQYLSNNG